MNTRDTSVRQNKAGQDLMRKAAMLFVSLICCILVTTSGTWLTSKGVVAVGGVPVLVNAVSKDDIQNAKNKRDAARAEAQRAADTISQLEDNKTDLQGELAKLNAASEEQRAQYEIIYAQLEAALLHKTQERLRQVWQLNTPVFQSLCTGPAYRRYGTHQQSVRE